MTREEFEDLVGEAVSLLPERLREKLDNVDIVVEEGESPHNSLYGLYCGVNKPSRAAWYGSSPTLPDKITLWQGTIERFAPSMGGPVSLVRRVVWHEIAHHLGFDEPAVQALEHKWEREGKLS